MIKKEIPEIPCSGTTRTSIQGKSTKSTLSKVSQLSFALNPKSRRNMSNGVYSTRDTFCRSGAGMGKSGSPRLVSRCVCRRVWETMGNDGTCLGELHFRRRVTALWRKSGLAQGLQGSVQPKTGWNAWNGQSLCDLPTVTEESPTAVESIFFWIPLGSLRPLIFSGP